MTTLATALLNTMAALGLSILAAVSAANAPSAAFTASTPNPAANSAVQFNDASSGAPTSWAWDFGDGTSSTQQNPAHVYASPGTFTAKLTVSNASGPSSSTMAVTVTAATVLRLNAAHSFDLTLAARDPRTGNSGAGTVIGQNDVYGYFSIPSVSGNAGNPEVIVKMVDATAIGQNYWVFYGCMTDLEYTLSVKENATGVVKTYSKDAGKPCGQFDTTGFLPTATPTAGPSPTPTPPATPTPAAPTVINLDAHQFAWKFQGGGTSFTVKVGTRYELHITDSDPERAEPHAFSGIPSMGLSAATLNPSGAAIVLTFTPAANQVGSHPFSCGNSACGNGHDDMIATLVVAP